MEIIDNMYKNDMFKATLGKNIHIATSFLTAVAADGLIYSFVFDEKTALKLAVATPMVILTWLEVHKARSKQEEINKIKRVKAIVLKEAYGIDENKKKLFKVIK